MASDSIARNYVYALFREDGVTPFYIGIGRGTRWLQHERQAYRNRTHKDRIILRMQESGLTEIPKVKLVEGLTFREAAVIERDLILLIGRKPIGPLSNLTDGGEGLNNPAEEVRQKLRDARKHFRHTEASKAKIGAAGRGKKYGPRSDELKKRLSEANKGFRHTPEAIAKIVAAGTGRK